METIVRKADLVKELYLVQGIVERKNSIPILSNVLIDAQNGKRPAAASPQRKSTSAATSSGV